MRFNSKFLTNFVVLYMIFLGAANAKDSLFGKDIKLQASQYFNTIGIKAEVLTSDKRAFFYCSENLKFFPRIENDWRTIETKCESEKWGAILRTTAQPPSETTNATNITGPSIRVLSTARNISKGQVIDENDLILVSMPKQRVFEGFDDVSELIGRKVTSNLIKGTILKPRHIKYKHIVTKNDTVLVIVGNNKLSISTYGTALTSGQKGDMISVENLNSKKTFKAIVLDEKKVTPLTNM